MDTANLDLFKIILEAGIVVKMVLLLLILASVLSWAIVIKKRKLMKEIDINNKNFMNIYSTVGSLKEIMNSVSTLPFSPFKCMFMNGYEELNKIRNGSDSPEAKDALKNHFQVFGLGVLERSLKSGVNESNIRITQFSTMLASIGSISPFIGLFGTVWGIIDSFTGIAGGGATLDAVAPGIAEALVATAIGLAAAIPAVWFYNHFAGEANRLNSEMESFGQEFLNLVERSIIATD